MSNATQQDQGRLSRSWGRFMWVIESIQSYLTVAVILGLGVAAFDRSQAWFDDGRADETVRWVLPITFGLLVSAVLTIISMTIAWLANRRVPNPPPSFDDAVLAHAKFLSDRGRDQSLLGFREAISPLLHAWGYNEARLELGRVALRAAAGTRAVEDEIAIRVDDIGWSQYLLGDRDGAIQTLDGVVSEIESLIKSEGHVENSLKYSHYKALRHLAIIEASESVEKLEARLDSARKVIGELVEPETKKGRLEDAQLRHARALGISSHYSISDGVVLSRTDSKGRKQVAKAIKHVTEAAQIFEDIEEVSRAVKAWDLLDRLAASVGDNDASLRARERTRRLMRSSLWSEDRESPSLKGG